MEVIAAAALIGSGIFLTKDEKLPTIKKPIGIKRRPIPATPVMPTAKSQLEVDRESAGRVFKISTFNDHGSVSNPNYDPRALWKNVDAGTMKVLKDQVDIYQVPKTTDLNDVGFEIHNLEGQDMYSTNQMLPSIDDSDRDIQMIHTNMVPFFGSTVKQNINDTGATQHILETYTGNFRHTRRDNKHEVEYLFDPAPNQGLVHGADANTVTNRDKGRLFPSSTGKKHNELPFEQIRVGPGVANGYTARPSGGFHQDVRVLPKTTEDLQVNPKITYEGRIKPGRSPTEKGRLIGTQTLKSPKAIVWNHNGERNFTGSAAHQKNRQRPDIIFRPTVRHTLHSEHVGGASVTHDSKSTPEALRGKKRIAHKRNFANTPFRNLTQSSGKQMNDFGKSGFQNKPTERSEQSTRVHYTNVTQVGGKRGQQYNFNDTGLRYTRKQDLIENRPGSSGCGGIASGAKSGPVIATRGQAYDPTGWAARATVRETTENQDHAGFLAKAGSRGTAYDNSQWAARATVRETTENSDHAGFMGKTELKGPAYDEMGWDAKTTIRETTENQDHAGFLAKAGSRGSAYDNSQWAARTTVRETTENQDHAGFLAKPGYRGTAYDSHGWAGKTTIRETTEKNDHAGFLAKAGSRGTAYDDSKWAAKTTIKETTENQEHAGFVGKTVLKGKVYDENETARTTIRETTENQNHQGFIQSGRIQNGLGYTRTKWEAKMPQKAYLCNNEYVGTSGAVTHQMPKTYDAEYQVNTNKEQIAVGRAPNCSRNAINAGSESVNICVNKLEADREVPWVMGKGTSLGNQRNPDNFGPCTVTSRKNVPGTQIDRLQVDVLDSLKNNPLFINQNFN